MNSSSRRSAFALPVSRIGTHSPLPDIDPLESDRSYSAGGAMCGFSGTRLGFLIYLIAIVAVPLIHAARVLGRKEAAEIRNRVVVAGSRR